MTLNGLKHFYKNFNSLVFLLCNSKKISLQNRSKSVSSVFLLIYFIFIFIFFSIYICYFFLILSSNLKNKKIHFSFSFFFFFFFFFGILWIIFKTNINLLFLSSSISEKKMSSLLFYPYVFYNLNSHPLFYLQSSQ